MQTILPVAAFSFVLTLLLCAPVRGQDNESLESDVNAGLNSSAAEIREAVASYVAAFNSHDVNALSRLWTEEGIYTIRSTGERILGREAITKQFQEILDNKNAVTKIAVETASIEFVSPRVAVERGTAAVTRGKDDVTHSSYSTVYLKEDGRWLIDRVTEEEMAPETGHYEQLKDLEWIIGDWIDAGEGFTISTACSWTAKQNFISRTYTVDGTDGFLSSGLQIIGWDAKRNAIRSWLFDSDGGFISGTWSRRGEQWVVQSVATLADGSSGSFTSIFEPQDDGTFTWQKINRVLDGRLLPNIDEVIIQPR